MPQTRPNILFAFADDWGRYASAYANLPGASSLNQFIDTPSIDRIAREGTMFTNAHVPAPTCTPCRSSVLSGRYFWQTRLGAILEGAVWDDSIPTYPLILEESGYAIGASYKVWGPGNVAGTTPYGDASHYFNEGGNDYWQFSQVVSRQIREGQDREAAKNMLYEEVRYNFTSFLDTREDDQPFCYWWGPTNTHRAWEKGSSKTLWDIDPDDLTGHLPGFFPDVQDVREDVADYLGECMAYDRGLNVLLEELEESGELDNTLIVVSGDHGIPGFPRAKCNLYGIGSEVGLLARLPGAIPAGTQIHTATNLMDLAPTFLEVGGCKKPDSMTAHSLWPQMCAQEQKPADTAIVIGRERHVATAREWNLPYPQRAIRNDRYLYIHNFEPDRWPMGDPQGMDDLSAPPIEWTALENDTRAAYADLDAGPTKAWMVHHRNDPEHTPNFLLGFDKRPQHELYDLRDDPDQMVNLASAPTYADVVFALKNELMSMLQTQQDPRVCEKDCRFEHSPYTDTKPGNMDPPCTRQLANARLERS